MIFISTKISSQNEYNTFNYMKYLEVVLYKMLLDHLKELSLLQTKVRCLLYKYLEGQNFYERATNVK